MLLASTVIEASCSTVWTTRGAARMEMPGAKQRHEHFADRPVYDLGIRRWLGDFMSHWLQCGSQRPRLVAAE